MGCTTAIDYPKDLMKELTQAEIEKLTPEEYAKFLSQGDIPFTEDDELSEDYLRMFRLYDL